MPRVLLELRQLQRQQLRKGTSLLHRILPSILVVQARLRDRLQPVSSCLSHTHTTAESLLSLSSVLYPADGSDGYIRCTVEPWNDQPRGPPSGVSRNAGNMPDALPSYQRG